LPPDAEALDAEREEGAAPGVGGEAVLEAHAAAAASNEMPIAAEIQRTEWFCADGRMFGFVIRERSHTVSAIGGDEGHTWR
jgi:hypothetical protein